MKIIDVEHRWNDAHDSLWYNVHNTVREHVFRNTTVQIPMGVDGQVLLNIRRGVAAHFGVRDR